MEERTIDSRRLYEGRLVNLRQDRVILSSGRETTREVVEHANCVAIVAIDPEGEVLMVRQFRKPVGEVLLEIPAGVVEDGEEPLDSAHRELEEETGYVAGRMEKIGGFYSSPGYSTEFLHLFLASELRKGEARPDGDEIIEVVSVPFERTLSLILSGELCDAKSIAGLFTVAFGREEEEKQ